MDGDVFGGVNGQWMTYAELAQTRGIDKPSALKLALRRKWRRRKDNHGRIQVYVPTESLPPPEEVTDISIDRSVPDVVDTGVHLSRVVAGFEAAIAAIREAHAAEIAANERHVAVWKRVVAGLERELEQARAENARLTEDAKRRGLMGLPRWRRRG